jgi:hypothetical protein
MMSQGSRAALLLALVAGGCSSTGGQLGTLRTQNRSLLEQTNAQLAEIENLKEHARRLEDKLIDAEEQLTALENQNSPAEQRMVSETGDAANRPGKR